MGTPPGGDTSVAAAASAGETSPEKPPEASPPGAAVAAANNPPSRAPASEEPPPETPVAAQHPLSSWPATPIQPFYAHGSVAAPGGGLPPGYYAAPPVSANSVVWGHQYAGHGFTYAPFFPPGTIFAPTAMPMGMTYLPSGTEGKSAPEKKNKDSASKAEDERVSPGGKATTSASGENLTKSDYSAQEGSSDTRTEDNESKDLSASKKRNLAKEGEASHSLAMVPCNGANAESSYTGRARSAKKLPVSAPGRTTSTFPQTNSNKGMELWNKPHVGFMPVNVKNDEVQSVQRMAGHQGMPEQHQCMQNERELKREKRKQSNRESARRSRFRKQQECEELEKKVTELTNENNILREELDKLKKACGELDAENTSISETLTRAYGPKFLAVLGIKNDPSDAQTASPSINLFLQGPINSCQNNGECI